MTFVLNALERPLARRALRLAALVGSLACTSARVTPIVPAAVPANDDAAVLAGADALALEGCYDCLLEARDGYARVAARTTSISVLTRLFEADLLIALREKELALPSEASVARARLTATQLDPTLDPDRLITAVTAVRPNAAGSPEGISTTTALSRQAFVPPAPGEEMVWRAETPVSPAVRRYVSHAVDCAYDSLVPTGPDARPVTPMLPRPTDTAPLVRYRVAICAAVDPPPFERIRGVLEGVSTAVPRFVETRYQLARLRIGFANETGGDDIRLLLNTAYARFSRSPAVTYLFAQLNEETGNCPEALRYFDETLALEARHDKALLGRTVCLTTLGRPQEAIEAATRLIGLNASNAYLGYYWRAANRHGRKELDLARRDIEKAREVMGPLLTPWSGEVLTLAGVIEHDQDSLAIAEGDLRAARDVPGGEALCTARWFLSSVLAKQLRWGESAAQFEDAMTCYDFKAERIRATMERIRTNPRMSEAYRSQRLKELAETLAESWSAYYAAAFNASNNHVRSGNVARARETIEIAARDTALAESVAKLRGAMNGGP